MRKFIPINKKRWFNAARHHFQGGGLWESPYDQPEVNNEKYQPQIFNQDINQMSNDTGIDDSSEITKKAGKAISLLPSAAEAAFKIGEMGTTASAATSAAAIGLPIAGAAIALGQVGAGIARNAREKGKNKYGEYVNPGKAKGLQFVERVLAPENWFKPGVEKEQKEAIRKRKSAKEYNEALLSYNPEMSYDYAPTFAYGGPLPHWLYEARARAIERNKRQYGGYMGDEFNNDELNITHYYGNKHNDINGSGIPIGQDAEMEGGEVKIGDYIFSDSINIDGTERKKNKMKKSEIEINRKI